MIDTGYFANIRCMDRIKRKVIDQIKTALARGKSVLLLGPRQVGKTTIVQEALHPDIALSFAKLETKHRYEKNPVQFEQDLNFQIDKSTSTPLVFVDEVQKIPEVMDGIQHLIDNNRAQFILSGSSARKLKHGPNINLLPGRVVTINMDPLSYAEIANTHITLDTLLRDGSLPGILLGPEEYRECDLTHYMLTYLEEEIRQEALVRNIGAFSRFLELAAIESGNTVNFTRIAEGVGISDTTIKEYYQVLEDCLVAFKIPPITKTTSRRSLLKSPKYLLFDLGIRRIAAEEGPQASIKTQAHWFEQWVGLEILRNIHIHQPLYTLHYWRDTGGTEIDYVINTKEHYIPVEVKWSDMPKEKDARHLVKFIDEYDNCELGYIICRTPTPYKISEKITALPWQAIDTLF